MSEGSAQNVTVVTSTKSIQSLVLLLFCLFVVLSSVKSYASQSDDGYFGIGATAAYLPISSVLFDTTLGYGISASFNKGPFRVNLDYIQASGLDYNYAGGFGGFGSFTGEAESKRYGVSFDYIFLDKREGDQGGFFLGAGVGYYRETITGDANFDNNAMYSGNFYFSNINTFQDLSLDETLDYWMGEIIAGYKMGFFEISTRINTPTDFDIGGIVTLSFTF